MVKTRPDRENSRKYLSFGEKIVKIGPVDHEIIKLKKEDINANKIYSPSGKFAKRAKQYSRGSSRGNWSHGIYTILARRVVGSAYYAFVRPYT